MQFISERGYCSDKPECVFGCYRNHCSLSDWKCCSFRPEYADAIASAIATRSGDVIQPSGAHLANQLGLDTQVPAKPVYITSGNATKKKIANYPIIFNHSKFLNKSSLSINATKVVNALYHMGKQHITDHMLKNCSKILNQRDKAQLQKNLKQLPYWMIPHILKIIRTDNERATKAK